MFEESFIYLMMTFAYSSSYDISCAGIIVMLSWFQEVILKIGKFYVSRLPKKWVERCV